MIVMCGECKEFFAEDNAELQRLGVSAGDWVEIARNAICPQCAEGVSITLSLSSIPYLRQNKDVSRETIE